MRSITHPDVTSFTFVSIQRTPVMCHSHGLTPNTPSSSFLFVNPFTRRSIPSEHRTPYTENPSVSQSVSDFRETREVSHSRARLQHSHCISWPIWVRFGSDLRMPLCIHELREDRCREGRTALQNCTWQQTYADKCKGKDHTITCHEGRGGEQRNSSTLSLTKALGGVGG